jgi:hypothetical protein
MDSMQIEIARFLAEKAMRQTRATYQQVGDAVGWNHPTGRGLGKNLEVVLHALHDRGLPPLTTILVKRGERHPASDAITYIRGALGDTESRPPNATCSPSIGVLSQTWRPIATDFLAAAIFG